MPPHGLTLPVAPISSTHFDTFPIAPASLHASGMGEKHLDLLAKLHSSVDEDTVCEKNIASKGVTAATRLMVLGQSPCRVMWVCVEMLALRLRCYDPNANPGLFRKLTSPVLSKYSHVELRFTHAMPVTRLHAFEVFTESTCCFVSIAPNGLPRARASPPIDPTHTDAPSAVRTKAPHDDDRFGHAFELHPDDTEAVALA